MIQPSSLIADAEWPPKNVLRLHEINGPGNFKAEMIFEFDQEGKPVDVEMCDIPARTKEEAAELARVKWGWCSVWPMAELHTSPTASPLQSEWQMWGGNWEREIPFRKKPESAFPREKRFVVEYETTHFLTDGTWSKPRTQRAFRLADCEADALASVKTYLDDPKYFDRDYHVPSQPRVMPCPDMPAYFDTFCRFDGDNDIRKL